MKSVFILTINGKIYLFDNKNIDNNMIIELKKYAQLISKEKLNFNKIDDVYDYFLNIIEKKLKIILKKIPITDVIRININIDDITN